MKPNNLDTTHNFGECLACGKPVTAGVVVAPNVGRPQIGPAGTVTLTVEPKIVGLAVNHRCGGAEFPPEADETA